MNGERKPGGGGKEGHPPSPPLPNPCSKIPPPSSSHPNRNRGSLGVRVRSITSITAAAASLSRAGMTGSWSGPTSRPCACSLASRCSASMSRSYNCRRTCGCPKHRAWSSRPSRFEAEVTRLTSGREPPPPFRRNSFGRGKKAVFFLSALESSHDSAAADSKNFLSP